MLNGTLWSNEEITELRNTYPNYQLFRKKFDRSANGYFRKARKFNLHKTPSFIITQSPVIEPPNFSTVNYITGALPLDIHKQYTKFVMLNDVHVPHNIDLTKVFNFISSYEPEYVLLVGDIINNDPFSHWERARRGTAKNMPQPKPYFEKCQKLFFDPLRSVAGKNCKIGYWIGNHEYWSNKAIEEMPEGEGYWEVENNIKGIDFWVPNKGIASLGKLHFMHGDNFSGRNHANKILSLYRRNIRYGHFHNIEESTHNDPIDITDRHTARSCGCLEKFNPSFMGNRPHSWMHAFTYGVVNNETGNFFDHTTQIINNQFMAHGYLW